MKQRVKATGLPGQYDVLLTMVSGIFYILIAFTWSDTLLWYTPLIIFIIATPLSIMKNLGTMLQDPFGDDAIALPLEIYCQKIEHQIHAVAVRSFNYYDLSTGPDTSRVENNKALSRKVYKTLNSLQISTPIPELEEAE